MKKETIIWFAIIIIIPFIIDGFGKRTGYYYNSKNNANTAQEEPQIVEQTTFNITIKVQNIKNTKGYIKLALFNESDNFPSDYEYAILSASKTIKDINDFSYTFESIDKGEYAVAVFLDHNSNKKLDTGIFGIPLEQYGFSNNPKINFKAPTFKESSFILDSNREIIINLN